MQRAVIIGGCVVGLSIATGLQRVGIEVTVIDAAPAAGAASWGNAGHIATEQVEPLASWAVLRSAPRRLFSRGGALGLPPQAWLTTASLAIPSLLIIATWRWVGVNMLYFNSGLVNIARELYEAAAIDGAKGTQMFRHITVPLMRPTIMFVLIISVIGGFQLFVEPLLMWSGGNSPSNSGMSVALLIYRTAFTSFRFGDAAAMGVVLAFLILIVSLVAFRLVGGTKALR